MLITFGYKNNRSSLIRALIAIVIGLLLLFYPNLGATRIIVLLIGVALLIFGGLMFLMLIGALTLTGGGAGSMLLAVLIFAGGIVLLWNPFGERLMGIIAGVLSLVYGIDELLAVSRLRKARKNIDIKPGSGEARTSSGRSSKDGIEDVEYERVDD